MAFYKAPAEKQLPCEELSYQGVTLTRADIPEPIYWKKGDDKKSVEATAKNMAGKITIGTVGNIPLNHPNVTEALILLNIVTLCKFGAYEDMEKFINTIGFNVNNTFEYKPRGGLQAETTSLLAIATENHGPNSRSVEVLQKLSRKFSP